MALSRNDGDLRNLMSILAGTYDRLLDSGVTHFFLWLQTTIVIC